MLLATLNGSTATIVIAVAIEVALATTAVNDTPENRSCKRCSDSIISSIKLIFISLLMGFYIRNTHN